MKKRCSHGFLLALLVILMPLTYVKGETFYSPSETLTTYVPEESFYSTLDISHYESANLSVHVEGDDLVFTDFPDGDAYNYVMLITLSASNKESHQKTYQTDHNVSYDLSDLKDGTYAVSVYFNSDKYGTYHGYLYHEGSIALEVLDGSMNLMISPVYQNNCLMRQNYSEDPATLDTLSASQDGVIIALAREITADLTSDYDKARAIHDWIANNIWYDYDAYYKLSEMKVDIASTLKDRKTVCEGQANLAVALLRASGIPAIKVSGYALGLSANGWDEQNILLDGEQNHAWAEAYVDGRWIIMDPTWDSDNEYENGIYSSGTGLDGYRYFDPSLEWFSQTHCIKEVE